MKISEIHFDFILGQNKELLQRNSKEPHVILKLQVSDTENDKKVQEK